MALDEAAFEDEICAWLVDHGGYRQIKVGNAQGEPTDFDADRGLDTAELFAFIGATQGDTWSELIGRHGGDPNIAQRRFADRLAKQLDERGTVDVLRNGVDDLGITIKLAHFRPAHGLTPELVARYEANRLTVTRQLPYDPASAKTIDLGLFVNGIPVATAELKNKLTGQSVEHAIRQYRHDRDARNTTLAARAVVHFAVDPDRVMMTTRLEGTTTRFLPFNQGHGWGAGNPPNPNGHRTAYLWERVWARDPWLDVLGRFVHVETTGRGRNDAGPTIFPRFHQWDAVRSMEAHARDRGAGHHYLVQHSAGSGKSNTIAWLAHRLSTLFGPTTADGDTGSSGSTERKVFDKVIVITDRVVLDRQLQRTIYQFEHKHGMVEKIDRDSQQLADALEGEAKRIIITTLQKFPVVLEKVDDLPDRTYAVIVDEAHSSQSGEAAKDLRLVLGDGDGDDATELTAAEAEDRGLIASAEDPVEAALAEAVGARQKQPNLSFFAFTATPKQKTLELFGEADDDGTFHPFHLYSMRQAIDEGFILDVLQQYTTWDTYWRLAKAVEDDPAYETPKARAALTRFVDLHETNLSQKAEIIVSHFRDNVAHKIDGRAKAMVVTSSRLHAVRYKLALARYLRDQGIGDVSVLVAFSGTVQDGTAEWTETAMNGFPESQTVTEFASDAHQIMVVAEKFQTGFDQPLLYAMYVDKSLSGVAAVQTLSRLNRIHPGKDGTVVLDFRNEAEDIQQAFADYHVETTALPTDLNVLTDSRAALDEYGVLRPDEVESVVCLIMDSDQDHGRVHAALAPAVDRFRGLDEDEQVLFRDALNRFIRIYAFVTQIAPFGDTGLERDYLYGKALARLIAGDPGTTLDLSDEVELTHLRIEQTHTGSIELPEDAEAMEPLDPRLGPYADPDEDPLSLIIEQLNERHGLKLTEADGLHIVGIFSDLGANERIQQQAAANDEENFGLVLEQAFNDAVADRYDAAEELTGRLLDDPDLRADVLARYGPETYGKAKVAYQEHCSIGELLARGEDGHLEYKATFAWDLREGRTNKALETASLKTIAAFANSREGGTLLIGVADDGTVTGLDADYAALHKEGKDDADRFLLHLNQAIINAVREATAANVSTALHTVDGHDLCRVHVRPSSHPVTANVMMVKKDGQSKAEKFFVRIGNGTRAIDDEAEIERYIQHRWPPTAT